MHTTHSLSVGPQQEATGLILYYYMYYYIYIDTFYVYYYTLFTFIIIVFFITCVKEAGCVCLRHVRTLGCH